ncbi:hypothetical protein [Amycolatopsis sp. NPDC058986]|uniref:hypothetical protein n=1 Tax=unclassified Amycolatopsis TaxID=2618356 RepID=UPI0036727D12
MSSTFTADPAAVRTLLAEHLAADPVVITGQPCPSYLDLASLIDDAPAAYSVQLVPTTRYVTVVRNGRWGHDEQMSYVDYPVPFDDPGFAGMLVAALRPVIDQELWLATEHEHRDRRTYGARASYEARDAVTRLF